MIVWCSIMVMINYGGIPFSAETAAKGKIKTQSYELYVVDFSEYAKMKQYVGDYSALIVKKDKCVKD